MSSEPLVSVVIIFLNAEKFIEEAIKSAFAQTYDHWELLLVDDGPTDESTDIALCYTERYPGKVCYLEHGGHRNRGASASRNLGIRYAQGEYIAFLDADDVWLPEILERLVSIQESNPTAVMVYAPDQFWYSWTGNAEDSQRDFVQELGVKPNTLFKPPTLLKLCYPIGESISPSTCNLMVRHKVIERVGGFE